MELRRQQHGFALLLDCHSMPSIAAWQGRKACRCGAWRPSRALLPARNRPGDPASAGTGRSSLCAQSSLCRWVYVTERYGQPEVGLNALQIEFRRDLFMNEETYLPHRGFRRLQAMLANLVEGLLGDLAQFRLALAA